MNKKQVLTFFSICLIAMLVEGVVIYASLPTTTQVLSGGDYPGSVDYTFYSDGTNYFAKNALGTNVYSGSDASDVINDGLSNGGSFAFVGSFVLTDSINITSNCYLYLQDAVFTPDGSFDSDTHMFVAQDEENIQIYDGFIDGDKDENDEDDGIFLLDCDNCIVQNVNITDCSRMGISLEGSNMKIIGNHISASGVDGIYMIDSIDIKICDNYIENVGDTGIAVTGRVSPEFTTTGITIIGNTILDTSADEETQGTNTNQGIFISRFVEDFTISNNRIQGITYNGIYLGYYDAGITTFPYIRMGAITNNNIRYCGRNGIHLKGKDTTAIIADITIMGNTIIDCNVEDGSFFGITTEYTNRTVIMGNVVKDTRDPAQMLYGIDMYASDYFIIVGNEVSDSGSLGNIIVTGSNNEVDLNQGYP